MTADIKNVNSYHGATIQGWTESESMQFLAFQASRHQKCVEIGVWKGRGTACMAEFACGKVWAVDHFMGSDDERDTNHTQARDDRDGLIAEVETNLRPWLDDGTVELVKLPSVEAAEALKEHGPFHFVWLDGTHTTEALMADIDAWKPLIAKGGLLSGHDASWESVQAALNDRIPGWVHVNRNIWMYPI